MGSPTLDRRQLHRSSRSTSKTVPTVLGTEICTVLLTRILNTNLSLFAPRSINADVQARLGAGISPVQPEMQGATGAANTAAFDRSTAGRLEGLALRLLHLEAKQDGTEAPPPLPARPPPVQRYVMTCPRPGCNLPQKGHSKWHDGVGVDKKRRRKCPAEPAWNCPQ